MLDGFRVAQASVPVKAQPSIRRHGGLSPIAWLLLVAGCHRATPPPAPMQGVPPPTVQTVTVPAGTPVRLVLFDELTSGGSATGTPVRLALAEATQGLPAMSPVSATVSESRTEGTLGGLMNRPARLNLTLGALTGPNGESLPLSANPKEAKDYELNRGNTGRSDVSQKEPEEIDVSAGVAVQSLIAKGESGGLDAKQVGDLAQKLGMDATAKLAGTGGLDRAKALVRAVRQGTTVAGLATGGTVAAALELVNLAGDVGHRLGRTLGGRNIRAYPGTVVQAYVAQDTVIRLPRN